MNRDRPATTRSRARIWLGRGVVAAIFAAVAVLVVRESRRVDWLAVGDAMLGYGPVTVLAAIGLTVPAQLAYACYDLIGRHATGHRLPVPRVMTISYVGYFFSLNLGALIGGVALRYRLYAPYELSPLAIGQIIGLSVLTNWSGYVLIAGIVLVAAPPELPAAWSPGSTALRFIGAALLATAAGYLLLCLLRGGRMVRMRGTRLRLPTPGVAGIQLALSLTGWSAIGAVLAWLIPGDVGWLTVMPVVMVSAIAGIWSHVPGSLGVTEFVFLTLLGHRVAEAELLAAVLVFRAVYYLAPLAAAASAFLWLELTVRRRGSPSDGAR